MKFYSSERSINLSQSTTYTFLSKRYTLFLAFLFCTLKVVVINAKNSASAENSITDEPSYRI